MGRTAATYALSLLAILLTAPPALAAAQDPTASLQVRLSPERLGTSTTIIFSFTITDPSTTVPPPLAGMGLLYPANIGLVTSGLGLATCHAPTLEQFGPEGCPPDSLMGYGTALAEFLVGTELEQETGRITTWMAPVGNGHLQLLFDAEGESPVEAQFIFPAQLLPAPPPYGGDLETTIPPIPGFPEAPDISVVSLRTTIGPKGITYYQYEHGKKLAYHPIGLRLPETCPHGGFPFAASFNFLDGSHTTARTAVPCPKRNTRPAKHR